MNFITQKPENTMPSAPFAAKALKDDLHTEKILVGNIYVYGIILDIRRETLSGVEPFNAKFSF